jgi:hypothetical protein
MSKCTYCGTVNKKEAGYKGECPSCPPGAFMRDKLKTCKKCKGKMKKGIAMLQTWTYGMPDFIGQDPNDHRGQTMSAGGPGKVVEVMKCEECGWSYMEGNLDEEPKSYNNESSWCMCTVIDKVARDMRSTCQKCGGRDAYGGSKDRPEKYKKILDVDRGKPTSTVTSPMSQHKDLKAYEELKELTRELFVMLDWEEESNNQKLFHPTSISSCRTMHVIKLGEILPRMKELSKEK